MTNNIIICPHDHTILQKKNSDDFSCPNCLTTYSNTNGVTIFLEKSNISKHEEIQQNTFESIAQETGKHINLSSTFLDCPTLINHVLRKKYIDKLNLSPDSKILELGCQFGDHLKYLNNKFKDTPEENFYGVDIDLAGISIAKQRMPRGNFFQQNINNLPFEASSFDIVLFVGILEHLSDPTAVLAEIKRVIKPTGVLATYYTIKDYQYTWQHFLANILKIKKYKKSITSDIGHDYKNTIKGQKEYNDILLSNGFHMIRGERTGKILDAIFDFSIIKINSLLKLLFARKNQPCNKEENTSILTKSTALSKKQLLTNRLSSFAYKVFLVERLLLPQIGTSYCANYCLKASSDENTY